MYLEPSSEAKINDALYRHIEYEGSKEERIYVGETDSFAFGLLYMKQDREILVKIFGNLWKTLLYNKEYVSFLLGTYTEEEFMRIADEFASVLQNDISDEVLHITTHIYFNEVVKNLRSSSDYLNKKIQNLTSADLSVILNIDSAVVDKQMLQLGYTPDDSESE